MMEHLSNGMTLELCPGAFPLSTDSMVLADFVRLPPGANVLDLGAGCGTLGLLLCARSSGCSVTGIELDAAAAAAALENSRRNGLSDRLFSICADIRSMPDRIPAGSFRCVISNPPYFSGGPASRSHPAARREDTCSLDALFDAAERALQYGGDFYLVHRPERLAELCCAGSARKLEPKRLRLVRHRADQPVSLVLLSFRKGGKPGLQWEELSLYDSSGSPTADHRRIYHF